jgi:membrane protein DedA with SNARE-associated domain
MLLEGPIVTFIVSFASSLGYLNIWIILVLAFFGNQIPDILLYFIGRSLRKSTVEKILSLIGLSSSKVTKLRKSIEKHYVTAIVSFKIIPNFPIPGLILTGFSKLEFKKFFWTTLVSNCVLAIVFTSLGFFSGVVTTLFLKYFKLVEYALPIAILLSIALYFFVKWLYSYISKYLIEKND